MTLEVALKKGHGLTLSERCIVLDLTLFVMYINSLLNCTVFTGGEEGGSSPAIGEGEGGRGGGAG